MRRPAGTSDLHRTMVQLTPEGPPGRAARKAFAFHAEIVRLRARGYTLAAIREALAKAGVQVSLATISREASHTRAPPIEADRSQLLGGTVAAPQSPRASPLSPSSPPSLPAFTTRERCVGMALADAFEKTVIANPLFRSKE